MPAAPDRDGPRRPPPPLPPLATLRRRLTLWYVGTTALVLAALGAGLWGVIHRQIGGQLDASLAAATREVARAARIREAERAGARGAVVDALDELRIPERALFLADTAGRAVAPADVPAWVSAAARRAARAADGTSRGDDHLAPGDVPGLPGGRPPGRPHGRHGRDIRVRAERFQLSDGTPLVAVAAADRVELERRYAALIAAFGGAALAALVLVATGGWVLAAKSTAPVERSVLQMRHFMADAAHELRTPVTVLRTRAEVALARARDPAEDARTLRGIAAESGRLGALVDDLLTLARADAGERPPARERVFLDDVVLDAADAARDVATARGVSLDVAEFEEAPVVGDPALLRQLAMLLLDNAVKFTPPGGTVRVAVGTAVGGGALLRVTDTGVGIAPEDLPYVFTRFWRADPARTRAATAGAGLGLSIARWITDEHGAALDLASTPGAGTTASVRFPPVS